MFNPEVERVSDVDLAVEIVEKEADSDRARSKNYNRAEALAAAGHKFRNVVEMAGCWHFGGFQILEGPEPRRSLGGLRGGKELRLGLWVIKSSSARISRCFRPAVTMMKTAKPRRGHDLGLQGRMAFDRSFGRSVLVQTNVSTVLMVVSKVLAPEPPNMKFV
jgi:hypothetical protein